ncbi:hypothetical protein SKAU_G00128970 [Synaphobranchus kaupii]|uniref:Secreted protein n=1 Tax=Synaphobranchus kaupii TaxID=118154 RepID=A0A9Q1FQK2_SYNKA|nr:hypothetical protein SKAU_G00128970 [Synaphobranchus kaupii]
MVVALRFLPFLVAFLGSTLVNGRRSTELMAKPKVDAMAGVGRRRTLFSMEHLDEEVLLLHPPGTIRYADGACGCVPDEMRMEPFPWKDQVRWNAIALGVDRNSKSPGYLSHQKSWNLFAFAMISSSA